MQTPHFVISRRKTSISNLLSVWKILCCFFFANHIIYLPKDYHRQFAFIIHLLSVRSSVLFSRSPSIHTTWILQSIPTHKQCHKPQHATSQRQGGRNTPLPMTVQLIVNQYTVRASSNSLTLLRVQKHSVEHDLHQGWTVNRREKNEMSCLSVSLLN